MGRREPSGEGRAQWGGEGPAGGEGPVGRGEPSREGRAQWGEESPAGRGGPSGERRAQPYCGRGRAWPTVQPLPFDEWRIQDPPSSPRVLF